MRRHRRHGGVRVLPLDRLDHLEMIPEDGDHELGVEPRLVAPDQLDLDQFTRKAFEMMSLSR